MQQLQNQKIEISVWKFIKHYPTNANNVSKTSNYIKEIFDNVEEAKQRAICLLNSRKQLYKLLEIPQVEQRSPEWYAMRKERLTASDTAQAIGKSKYGSTNQLVDKKAFPEKYPFGNSMYVPALRHGVIYESVALRCYRQRQDNIKVYEFGMIPHYSLSCYGASPDGITELGVMIEIKCPLKRIIDGTIPEQYWYQMQGQMAVCQLNECEYIECDIQEFRTKQEYLDKIGSNDKRVDHGIIVETKDEGLKYSDEMLTPEETIQWAENIKNVTKINYWYLRKILYQRVLFDEKRWKEYEPIIINFWEKVKIARTKNENTVQQPPVKKYAYLPDSDDEVN